MTDSYARTVILLFCIGVEIFMVVSVTAFLSKPHLSTQSKEWVDSKCMSKFWPQDVPVKCWPHLYHAWLNHCSNFKSIIVKPIKNSSLVNGREIAFSWWLQNLNDEKSTLVQVIAWCCQTISYCITLANVDIDIHQHIASLWHYELIIALTSARERKVKVWIGMLSLMIVKMTVFTVVKNNEMHILASNQPLIAC